MLRETSFQREILPLLFVFITAFLIPQGLFAGAPLSPVPIEAASVQEARLKIIAAAEKYRGTPYRYGGADRRGLDCSGLVYLSFHDALAVAVPRTVGALYRWVEKIPEAALQAGDLVFFNTTGMISHVGIYAGKGKFIHSASSGPKTGVMYSQLDEKYWRRTYAGAGRALPPGDRALSGPAQAGVSRPADGDRASAPGGGEAPGDRPAAFFAGIGLGSTWGSYSEDAGPLRGGVMQARLAYNLTVFDQPILIGLELRPEWDGSLEIFRMPFTLSLGFNDVIRIFGGPAFTIGEPVLKTNGGDRRYSGGNSWLGSLGISAAPFAVDFAGGALSLYGEFAWQSYTRGEGQEDNPNADFSAGFRFSTGVRYTRKL